MATLKAIKLKNLGTDINPLWDMDIVNGHTVVLEDAEALAQILMNKLRVWKGEWFGDVTAGVDYLGLFNQKTFLDKRFALILRQILLADTRVSKIDSLTVNFDRSTRTITAEFKLSTIYGAVAGAI